MNCQLTNLSLCRLWFFFLICLHINVPLFSQTILKEGFVLNGDATYLSSEDRFRLTSSSPDLFGSIWHHRKVDLRKDFVVTANLNFGTNTDYGADGIAFVLQNQCLSAGGSGGGLGIDGVSPSLIVKFDTYENGGSGDLADDHIAIVKNGDLDLNSSNKLAGPVCAWSSCDNIETGQEYEVKIEWQASTKTLNVYFVSDLRASYKGDIIANIFNHDPYAYWGFTAATGLFTNEHTVQVTRMPDNSSQLNMTQLCKGESKEIDLPGFTSYSWTPNQRISNTSIHNPVVSPTTDMTYYVSYKDGCGIQLNDSIKVKVNPLPTITISGDSLLCFGDSTTLLAHGASTYRWNTGSTNATNTVHPTTSTLYTAIGKASGTGCLNEASLFVKVNSPIDTSLFNENQEVIKANEPDASYKWMKCVDGGTYVSQEKGTAQRFSIQEGGSYAVAITKNGCLDTSNCHFVPKNTLRIPNAFSPNGDGLNDVWLIDGIDSYPESKVRVFNRWGATVYNSSGGYREPWNGKDNGQFLSQSAYYYVIELKGSMDGTDRTESGSLVVIR